MDLIKAAQPQWMNVNISDTARLDELFDHRDMSALGREESLLRKARERPL